MKFFSERMKGYLKKGAIVTDVGSAKSKVVSELEPLVKELGGEFIGGHLWLVAKKPCRCL
jgi:prephenate dehydrogenase